MTALQKIYVSIPLTLGIVLAVMWAAGVQRQPLILAGLAGLTGMGIWHYLRVAQRNRRMALALRTAMESGVLGGERAGR